MIALADIALYSDFCIKIIRIYGVRTFGFLYFQLGKDELQRRKPPSFLAVLTGMGEAAYRRADGVCGIPIRALGA